MKRTFNIYPYYYDTDWKLYSKDEYSFNPGVTVLVGCNGSGKTTLIHQIKDQLQDAEVLFLSFDNLQEGGGHAMSKAAFHQNYNLVSQMFCSSEGENIMINIGEMASRIGAACRKQSSGNEIWIFFDAADSGLSIDGVVEVKDFFNLVLETNPGKEIYIIVSTNAYEVASGARCMDVSTGEEIRFKDYADYRAFILKSRQKKDKRYKKRGRKNEQ